MIFGKDATTTVYAAAPIRRDIRRGTHLSLDWAIRAVDHHAALSVSRAVITSIAGAVIANLGIAAPSSKKHNYPSQRRDE
jgi:hypothetical protein